MPDETKTVETAESADAATGGQNLNPDEAIKPAETPTVTDTKKPESAKTFTQEELNRIVARESAKAAALALKTEADKKAEAELSELDKTKKQLETLQADNARLERERLLDRIAAKHKLPDSMRDRLRGETEEELDADAEEVAKFMKPTEQERAKPPGSEAQLNGRSDALMSDDEMKNVAKMMGFKTPVTQ